MDTDGLALMIYFGLLDPAIPEGIFQLLDFPIDVFFWLGHINWLAIIFNQQIPNEQNTYLTVTTEL